MFFRPRLVQLAEQPQSLQLEVVGLHRFLVGDLHDQYLFDNQNHSAGQLALIGHHRSFAAVGLFIVGCQLLDKLEALRRSVKPLRDRKGVGRRLPCWRFVGRLGPDGRTRTDQQQQSHP